MVCPQSTAVCAVFSTTKQARALVDSSIHHRHPASSAPGVIHDTPQQWMILLQHHGSIGASSGASDVARNSQTRTSTITLGGDSSDEEVREIGGDQGWSSDEDISPAEDSGDEYVPPGSRGERESDLEFSGFSALEEDEEEEHHSVSVVEEESDGESEGHGPEVPRGGRGRARGGARSPASSGDEGWSEDPPPPAPPPRYAPTYGKTWHNSACSNHCIRLRPVVPHKGTFGIFCGRN